MDEEEFDTDLIPWNTNDAALLPIFLFAFLLTAYIGSRQLGSEDPSLVILSLSFSGWFGWRALRAYESHRNLKSLHELYGRLSRGED